MLCTGRGVGVVYEVEGGDRFSSSLLVLVFLVLVVSSSLASFSALRERAPVVVLDKLGANSEIAWGVLPRAGLDFLAFFAPKTALEKSKILNRRGYVHF